MATARLIARLDVKAPNLVKGISVYHDKLYNIGWTESVYIDRIRTLVPGHRSRISRMASMPFIRGIALSMRTISG